MKGETIAYSLGALGLIACLAFSASIKQEDFIQKNKPRHIAWCIDVCMEDIFKDMHNKGESWGTGSSSMNGMQQSNTFTTIKAYCETIYVDTCFTVPYGSPNLIHRSNSIDGAAITP